jgi:dihydrofolate reductase
MAVPLAIIAAIADNGVIGRDNKLIWRLRSDLRRFRALTMGKPLIMGRRTYQSLGQPLKGREIVVITASRGFKAQGVHVVHSFGEAVAEAEKIAARADASEIMVGGGAKVYAEALPLAKRLYLTLVHCEPAGDAYFPRYSPLDFREKRRERHDSSPDDEHPFTFVDLERRSKARGPQNGR